MGKELIFYYDVICPYANLATKFIEGVAKRNSAELRWRPVVLHDMLKQSGQESIQKQRIIANDLAIQYERNGLKINKNIRRFPDSTLNAMRLISAVPDETSSLRSKLTRSLYDVFWIQGQDISDVEVLQNIANSLAWDVDVGQCLQDDVVKETLKDNTKEAVERGAFGVPSMWVDNRLFFGGDRMFLVEQALGNNSAEPYRLLHKPLQNFKEAKLTVYFDFSSPWAYIGFKRIPKLLEQVSDVKVSIEWVPILIGGLFNEIGIPNGPLVAMGGNRRKYFFTDLSDHMRFYGIDNFQLSSHFPIRTVLPCRIAIANPSYEMMEKIYDSAWIHDLDISKADVLREVLSGSGYDFDELHSAASSEAVKLKLRENTQRALEAGACGVPCFQVNDGPLLFGQDRLNVVEDMIYGWKYEGADSL